MMKTLCASSTLDISLSFHRTSTRAEHIFQNFNKSHFFSVYWSTFCVDFQRLLGLTDTGELLRTSSSTIPMKAVLVALSANK